MSVYRLTSPDGQEYEVEAPDDATEAQVMEYFQNNQEPENSGTLEAVKSAIPNVLRGATELGSGVIQAATSIGPKFLGVNPEPLLKSYDERVQGLQQEYDQSPISQAPGAGVGRFVGQVAPTLAVPMLRASSGLGRMGAAAIQGGGIGAAQYVNEDESRLKNTVFGAVTSAAVPGVIDTVKTVIAPFLKSGRERIVGNALRRLATDTNKAVENISKAETLVPGSAATTAQASKDPGLLNLERAVRSTPAGTRFPIRDAEQNAARQKLLYSIAKDDEALSSAIAKREEEAIPLINQARQSGAKVDIAPIESKINEILNGEAGKRDVVRSALVNVKRSLYQKVNDIKVPEEDVGRLYGVRKNITDAMEGRLGGEKSSQRFARKELLEVMKILDDQINNAAPQFKPYLEKYSKLSSPINQLEKLQEISKGVKGSGVDVLGENIVSQAKWFNLVTKNKKELSKTLSADQLKTLENIGKDLDRGVLSISGGKAAGSNTFQNLSTANVLGTFLGDKAAGNPIGQTALRPLAWMYKIPEQRLQEVLVDAMLDKTTAQMFMQKASSQNISRLSARLRQIAINSGAVASTE